MNTIIPNLVNIWNANRTPGWILFPGPSQTGKTSLLRNFAEAQPTCLLKAKMGWGPKWITTDICEAMGGLAEKAAVKELIAGDFCVAIDDAELITTTKVCKYFDDLSVLAGRRIVAAGLPSMARIIRTKTSIPASTTIFTDLLGRHA